MTTARTQADAVDWRRGASTGAVLAAILVALGLGLVFGLWGGIGGVLVGLCLLVVPAVFAFAIGQLVLAVLLPESPAASVLLAGEVSLLPLLAGIAIRKTTATTERIQNGAVGGCVLLGSGSVATLVTPRWLSALVIAVGIGIVIYGLHRYAVVTYERNP